jgi:Na+-translocating ferredoxin:NAD+ oxidoreductase RnfC subunit
MSVVDLIKNAGVVGAGGAGFPTYVKANSRVEFVIANGAECEPLIHKDYEFMVRYAPEIVRGMQIMIEATGANRGRFGIKSKNAKAVEAIEKQVKNSVIDMTLLGDFYPAGDEYELVYAATNRLIPAAGIPLDVGCVVNNVESLYNVAMAADGKPVTRKFVCVAGAVKKPCAFWVPVGTTFRELLEFAGGPTVPDFGFFIGGVMMGKLSFNLDEVVTKTTGGLIILPKDHYLIRRKNQPEQNWHRIGKSACDQCSYCTEFCPRYLLGYDVQPHKVMRSLGFTTSGKEMWNQYAELCCSCGLCTLYSCPEDLYPKEACDKAKGDMRQAGMKYKQSKPVKVHPIKQGRKVPLKMLMQRLKLTDLDKHTPFTAETIRPTTVKLMLSQHIGAKAVPTVTMGQRVSAGDIVAAPPADKLGCPVHASIDGTVSQVSEDFIRIKA